MNMLGSPQIGIGNISGTSSQPRSAATRTSGPVNGGGFHGSNFHAMSNPSIPKTLSHFSSGFGQGMNKGLSSSGPSHDTTVNDNAMGQRFLSSAGVDTQSLFRKARDLQAPAAQKRPPSQSQITTGPSPQGTQPAPSLTSTSTPFKLHPNLYTSIEEMRSATISNILLRQRQNTDRIVQEKIQARLASRAKRVQSKSSLGKVIPGTGRRILPVTEAAGVDAGVSYPVVDLNHELIQNHVRFTQTNPQESFTLKGLEKFAREFGNETAEYQSAITLFQTLGVGPSIGGTVGSGNISPHGLTVSSVKYLTLQFQNFVVSQVKNNPNQSSSSSTQSFDTAVGGLAGYIYKFVEMELGRSVTVYGTNDVLWRIIYYALRCGDFHCVQKILTNSPGQVDPIVMQYVNEACNLGGDVKVLDKIPQGLVNAMLELYRRLESRGNPASQQYELLALGLMSFSPMDISNLASTIEDYLFMGLWTAVRKGGAGGVDAVCTLAENVEHWGPEYFEDDNGLNGTASSGWAYVMPLLLCQQFKTGLGYLATKGGVGLCLAVHLGLAIHDEGIALMDLNKGNMTGNNSDDAPTDEEEFLQTLVMAFAKNLQNVSPASALDYLVHIPGDVGAERSKSLGSLGVEMKTGKRLSKNVQSQICNLVLDTKPYKILCGELAGDGSRLPNGALDNHFVSGVVSDILALTADQCIREARMADAAELLCLAMRYSDLLSVLNRQLASLLVVSEDKQMIDMRMEEKRSFWRGAAQKFCETYLKGGQSHVIKVLEAERNLSLGITFQLLLNLMEFFDRCRIRNWMGAWELIDNLDILPRDRHDIPSKVETFESLSSSIQGSFHHVISSAMEALSEQHGLLKKSLSKMHMQGPGAGMSGAGATEQRIHELRNKARVIVTFTGLISKACDVEIKSKIQRLEASMI